MDDDEFNDFQQAVEPTQETQPESDYKEQKLVEEENNFDQNKLAPIGPPLINPPSCRAAESIQSPNADIEIKDLEGSFQPHLNKIQSNNLTTPQDVFFNLDKYYSYSEPKIELIDYSNVNFIQQKNLFNEILADRVEDITFQTLENSNLYQKNEAQKDLQLNQDSHKVQSHQYKQDFNNFEIKYSQFKVESQVKEDQKWTLDKNQQIFDSNKEQQEIQERINQDQQQKIQAKLEQEHQLQEDDQFGDFQKTVPNILENIPTKINQDNQGYQNQIAQSQQSPSITKKRTRKQQLQQFVNSLSDYSFLFLQAFQSF